MNYYNLQTSIYDSSFQTFVERNPTYQYFIYDAKFDSKNFDWQLELKLSTLKIAIAEYIDTILINNN
jgi:hypothetical protein